MKLGGQFAEDCKQLGTKTANLMKLEALVQTELSALGPIGVPPFVGLSHAEIAAHLEKHAPNFDSTWQAFCRAQRAAGGSALCLESKIQLAALRQMIEDAFRKNYAKFDPAFLAAADGRRLMVRSTGQEDLDTFANAGGNLSISNVEPSDYSISSSVGARRRVLFLG